MNRLTLAALVAALSLPLAGCDLDRAEAVLAGRPTPDQIAYESRAATIVQTAFAYTAPLVVDYAAVANPVCQPVFRVAVCPSSDQAE